MKKWLRVSLVAAVIAGAGGVLWWLAPRSQTFYTDADRIREPMEIATPRDVLWQPPIRLSDEINSATDDYEPRVSSDGMTLFFVRGKAGENADIFVSRRIPKFSRDRQGSAHPSSFEDWTTPEPLAEINSPDDDLGPEPSPDGESLYFYSNRSGGSGGYDLWLAHRGEEGWLAPVNLGPGVNSPFNDYGPAVAPDGTTLYFASNRVQPQDPQAPDDQAWPATIREDLFKRDYDLFAAAITERGIGDAAPLVILNTPDNDGSPAVSPAGDFLYFASDRAGGQGGFDLYRARRLRGELLAPTNLGPAVNSAAHEMDPALALGGFGLHFSSDRPLARESLARESFLGPSPSGIHSASPQKGIGIPQPAVRERILEPARGILEPAKRPDYDIYQTSSREVFTENEVYHASIDWTGLWSQIGPSLLWALLSLLLLFLLLRLLGGLRSRELSLLVRCLLASVFLHLLLLFLLSFWEVTASIAGAIQRRGGIKIALVSPAQAGGIESQILGSLTEVQVEAVLVQSAQAAPAPLDFEAARALAVLDPDRRPIETEARSLLQHSAADSPAPAVEEFKIQNSEFKMPEAPHPPSAIALSLPPPTPPVAKPETDLTRPESVAASPAQAPPVSVASESGPLDLRHMDPNPRASNSLAANSFVQPEQPSEDAAAPAEFKVQNSEFKTAGLSISSDIAIALPAAAERPVSAPEAEAPRPESVAAATTQAPAFVSPTTNSANPDLAQIQPQPNSPVTLGAASLIQPDQSVTDAAPGEFRIQNSDFKNPGKVAPAPALSLALPSAPAGAVARRESDASDARPGSATAPLAQAPLLGMLPTGAPERVALAPATSPARPVAAASLAGAAELPDEARTEFGVAATAPVQGAEKIPEALALSLRFPTEIAPPENPYPQRQAEQKEEFVKRMGGSDETERAVAAALDWLAAHQSRDGRWAGSGFDRRCGECGGETELEVDVGLTGLALLCFLGANHTHALDGLYRDPVDRGVSWLLRIQGSDGDLRREETMYSHGIAAIALSEAYGMTRDPRLAAPVRSAIRFIENARNQRVGGWRYDPGQPGDTSVLGWQVMALKSAQMAGLEVSAESFTAAGDWLDKVSHASRPGQYSYLPNRRPSLAMTAEGMFVQQLLGRQRDEERMIASGEFITEASPDWDAALDTYYWYYATLALYQHQGELWEKWNRALTRELLAHQRDGGRPAGSWDPRGRWADKGGRVYQTALCTLMLEVYYRYLPLYSLSDQHASAER